MRDARELGAGSGPLRGIKVVELAGIGPGPHACQILADLGADVIRIDRPGGQPLSLGAADLLSRGRPSVALDLKHPEAVRTVLDLVERADLLVEGMRPGAMERLGLGPDECLARNPRLIYGRMTGWGQSGPLAHTAGHDLTYLAVSGVLHDLGQDRARPHFPANLVGDFGGGSTYLVIGLLAALLEARASNRGQVVDAAIVDGAAHLDTIGAALAAAGFPAGKRAAGLIDGGAPFYDVYETADGKHVAVAALESQFYAELLERLGLVEEAPDRNDPAGFPALRRLFEDAFRQRSRDEWAELFADSDACVAPVLTRAEAAAHPHLATRSTYAEHAGMLQPSPAPRFSRTEPSLGDPPPAPGADTVAALTMWGIPYVDSLIAAGAAVQVGSSPTAR